MIVMLTRLVVGALAVVTVGLVAGVVVIVWGELGVARCIMGWHKRVDEVAWCLRCLETP